jgi:hypothetical protein
MDKEKVLEKLIAIILMAIEEGFDPDELWAKAHKLIRNEK